MISPRIRLFSALLLLGTALLPALRADVVLNELVSASSDRLLQWDASGVPQVGTGARWYQAAFNDSAWQNAAGPFGYGTINPAPSVAIATNVQIAMQYLTPTLYQRAGFTVAAGDATRPDALQLVVEYNDGFVAYLNGVEIARRNGGPAKKLIYHDQPAYNREIYSGTAPIPTGATTETITLGGAASLLTAGSGNVLAIQALNAFAADTTFYFKADLRISGTPVVNLVNYNSPWKYFPGVVEPSGGVFDGTLLNAGRQTVPWGQLNFDDTTWLSGVGPFGFGVANPIGTNTGAAMLNITPSLYLRQVFTASAAQAADTLALKLVVSNDDSFIAYVNGIEVTRRRIGVPNTFTPRTAAADTDQTSVQTETILIDVASKILQPGGNVLAIQAHNFTAFNADFYIKADLQTNAGVVLAANTSPWTYLPGTAEPVPPLVAGEEDSSPEGPDSVTDWVELNNNGTAAVSLKGWFLSDDPKKPLKWTFPDVSIAAGGYLVIICDNRNITTPAAGGYLHTNFKLSRGGSYLALSGPAGDLMSVLNPGYPRQYPFHSYVRTAAGTWKYSDTATPGALNAGNLFDGVVATPTVSVPGRFYASPLTVILSCATPGAVVRYTIDGSEPTATSSVGTSLTFSSTVALRARAFLANNVPSDTITHTYLINQTAAKKSLPAVCLTGDQTRTFYKPFGVFAIVNNGTTNYAGGIWSQYVGATALVPITPAGLVPDPSLYHAPMQSGKPAERPLSFEVLYNDATADLRTGAEIRAAGSPFSRQRYVLTGQNSATPNTISPWSITSTEKPQINIFFRSEVGDSPVRYPLVPGSVVTKYDNIRLRAGKNDISNPFIRDEFCRRLMLGMGQVTVRGDFINVFIDGVFKGYFNICERPRGAFFQEARNSDFNFDVRNITAITDGDTLAFNEMMNYVRTRPLTPSLSAADYQGIKDRVDVVNLADYIVINSHAAMADWPGNNYVMDRERSAAGRWRFSLWDGEGGYGGFGRDPGYKIFNDIVTTSVATETVPAKLLYTVLSKSPEWRLLCADRIQKHLFNGGVLTDAKLTSLFTTLSARIQPIMSEVLGQTVTNFLTPWFSGIGDSTRYTTTTVGTTVTVVNAPTRRRALFNGFIDDTAGGATLPGFYVAQSLWPATLAPAFNQFGGSVAASFKALLTNPNGSTTGSIYFTTDGSDPRAADGSVAGTLYTTSISINQSLNLKARVRANSGEWSPLADAIFTTTAAPQVIISEIMYHPPNQVTPVVDGDEFEFIEIKNVGTASLNMAGWKFTDGIDFTFPAGTTMAPGAFLVLAKNATQFAAKYPGVALAGSYGPGTSLSNGGETVTLTDVGGNTVASVTYGDSAALPPWPAGADAAGYSLVPVNPNGVPVVNSPDFWRASAKLGGSPGADEPVVATPALLINEVLANSLSPQVDAIEIFNPTSQSVNCGYWWLSNSAASPKKFQIPAGTTIPANGYIYLDERAFNAAPGVGTNFSLDGAGGTVALCSGDASGALSGYFNTITYPAAVPGTALAPYTINSVVRWLPESVSTFGNSNAPIAVGPVVITEIMYNPLAPTDSFLELRNISESSVPLFDPANPTNTWRVLGPGSVLPGEVFTFGPGITLQPRQMVLLVPIDPATFRATYNVPASVLIYTFSGNLSKAGERIAIQRPLLPVSGQPLTYVDADAVTYDDEPPWPLEPDGTGPSLDRINLRGFADTYTNWRISTSTGGTPGYLSPATFSEWASYYFSAAQLTDPTISGSNADPDHDGISNFLEYAYGLDPLKADVTGAPVSSMANDGGSGPYLTLQYRRNVLTPNLEFHTDTASSLFNWSLDGGVPVGTAVDNGDGSLTVTTRDSFIKTPSVPQRFIRLRVFGQ